MPIQWINKLQVIAMSLNTSITLRGLKLNVFLGWPEQERATAQIVVADIHLQFPATLKACQSDNLEDTICYDTLVTNLVANLQTRSFKLLEHFGHEVYQLVKQAVTPNIKISIRILKHPPVPNLSGGVMFYCGEEHKAW
jgi:dihydroneopterin aldolase